MLPDVMIADISLGSRILAGVLWAGVAGLTVALVLLMRTRFGQARPLSKCVALSLYAHMLLMTYAYGTRLAVPSPPGDDDADLVHLHLVAADDDEFATPSPAQEDARAPAPWEMLAAETPPDFSLETPARQDVRMESPMPLPVGTTAPPEPQLPADAALAVEDVPSETDLPERSTPAEPLAATPVEIPDVQRREVVDTLVPQPATLERLDTSVASQSPAPQESGFDSETPLQELAELLTNNVAEALAASQDRLVPVGSLPENGTAGAAAADALPPQAWIERQMAARVPRRLADGEPVPELYRLRVARDRQRLARRLGATKESDEAVEAALRWLAAHQSEDGRWNARQFGAGQERKVLGHDRQGCGPDADTGITGLALLAMLGAGHTHLEGPYRETVQRGLEFLVSQQKHDGSLAGQAKLFATMYCHGMATLALGEAYAMTGDHRLKPYVERAADFSVRAQHGTTGGWRYLPGDPGDMSQFGWQVMALKSSELAGVGVPDKTKNGMLRFLHNNTSGRHRGLASYRAGERTSRTMTAEAFACRVFLGLECSPELTDEMASFVLEELPGAGQTDFYYWYYGSLAMFQLQDERWAKWNDALQRALTTRQLDAGDHAGSFDTDELWSGYGGRVYTTSMAALCLEVYYRYLPVYGDANAHKQHDR